MNQWDNKTNSLLNMKEKFAMTITVCYSPHTVKNNASIAKCKLLNFNCYSFKRNIYKISNIYIRP